MAALAPWRIQLGQYLGVLFIPLQLFGILPLWHLFRHQKPQLANGLLAGAIFFTIIGATYHGMLGMLGGYVTLHDTGATGVLAHRTEAFAMLKSMLEPYGAVLMLMYLALSVVLARECWQGIAHLPRWLAFLSPFGQYMLLLLLWLIVPPLGNFLVPAGINLTMAVFFGALSRQLYPPSPQAA
jgi:hypothetical protein